MFDCRTQSTDCCSIRFVYRTVRLNTPGRKENPYFDLASYSVENLQMTSTAEHEIILINYAYYLTTCHIVRRKETLGVFRYYI